MGGKRTSTGRSNSGGGQMQQPRISSAGSVKSSIVDSLSMGPTTTASDTMTRKLESEERNNDDDLPEYSSGRKNSFDIISLLESHEDVPDSISREAEMLNEQDGNHRFFGSQNQGRDLGSDVPSFWRFVQPETTNREGSEMFQRSTFQQQKHQHQQQQQQHNRNKKKDKSQSSMINKKPPPLAGVGTGAPLFTGNKTGIGAAQNKRHVKRRKLKKVQSAKVSGFKALERSPDRLQREGVEWLRVLTPPGTDTSSMCDADDDGEEETEEEDDELIKRYFSGLSSAGSSISWAEDAMESEFTSQLMKLWEDIEAVCGGGNRPEKMSDAVYEECLQWRKAFPNPNLHRFSRNEAEISPVESPTLDEEAREGASGYIGGGGGGGGDDDAQFSSLVNSPRQNFSNATRQGMNDGTLDENNLNSLQTSFRALNCTTPRPNIEKSTEYVNAWLSECQNSYNVPAHPDQTLPDDSLLENNSQPSSLSMSVINASEEKILGEDLFLNCRNDDGVGDKSRHSLRLVSDVARSSYANYSRSHAKFISDPDPENFFTSLAITNNQNIHDSSGRGRHGDQGLGDINTGSAFRTRNSSTYPNRFMEEYADDEDDDDRASPSSLSEMVSIRPNVRVQRPISSRVRDHTIAPIATGSLPHTSPYGSSSRYQHPSNNLNKSTSETSFPDSSLRPNILGYSQGTENYRSGAREGTGRLRYFESSNTNSSSPTSSAAISGGGIRGASAMKQGYNSSLIHYQQNHGAGSRSKQAPWSRHRGEESLTESLFETQAGIGYGGNTSGTDFDITSRNTLQSIISEDNDSRSPTGSTNNGPTNHIIRSSFVEGPSLKTFVPGFDDNTSRSKPLVSWFVNRRLSPN